MIKKVTFMSWMCESGLGLYYEELDKKNEKKIREIQVKQLQENKNDFCPSSISNNSNDCVCQPCPNFRR